MTLSPDQTTAVRRLSRTARRAKQTADELETQIRSTHLELGVSVRAIAPAVGLSKTRIHQIVHGRNR